jgi:hypothetical protein
MLLRPPQYGDDDGDAATSLWPAFQRAAIWENEESSAARWREPVI